MQQWRCCWLPDTCYPNPAATAACTCSSPLRQTTSQQQHQQLIENKEDTYINLLTAKLQEFGYSVAPTLYAPAMPPTAEAAVAAEAEKAEEGLFKALDTLERATAWLSEVGWVCLCVG